MQPDEILRLEYKKCIVMFQGHKPALLYKLSPEEFPAYAGLKPCRVADYIPAWKQKETQDGSEMEAEKRRDHQEPEKQTEAMQYRAPERNSKNGQPKRDPTNPARWPGRQKPPSAQTPLQPVYEYGYGEEKSQQKMPSDDENDREMEILRRSAQEVLLHDMPEETEDVPLGMSEFVEQSDSVVIGIADDR